MPAKISPPENLPDLASKFPAQQIGRALGVATGTALRWLREGGFPVRKPGHNESNIKMSEEAKKRHNSILQDRASGMTLQAIGNKHGVSRQRVEQILHRYRKPAGDKQLSKDLP